MKTTIGGDRLGSGNKQNISLKNYGRSTHDLSYLWRSSMSSGTLVPFMSEVGLPGDNFDIDLNCEVITLPTIGPLYGSYKVQLDMFQIPIRLYNSKLHMNMLGIGMDMSKITLPQLEMEAYSPATDEHDDNEQINSSSIFSYLNIRGLGVAENNDGRQVYREFNAVPYLCYWDIFKNYYANKQEDEAYVIHDDMQGEATIGIVAASVFQGANEQDDLYGSSDPIKWQNVTIIQIETKPTTETINVYSAKIWMNYPTEEFEGYHLTDNFNSIHIIQEATATQGAIIQYTQNSGTWNFLGDRDIIIPLGTKLNNTTESDKQPKLHAFNLNNIDTMRKEILASINEDTFTINKESIAPYNLAFKRSTTNTQRFSKQTNQEGLALKTYQSDLFNNWISTEWIDGTNGINEVTAISTQGDSFTVDALNLATKVYSMLNRIAISGGSYDDWLDAVYTHDRAKSVESPIYCGSLIKELAFEEVISNSASGEEPLGTLAGRGRLTNKNKGGKIKIKIDEPSYIMGIVSITPRVDYSQGNKWDVNLKTLNDLHKPALDEIGYQDLITDQLAWFDTKLKTNRDVVFKSAGKQPAWINYMTNVNQVRGHFAEKDSEMYMTLNRRYESGENGIDDLTTYVDPVKFNHIFADTNLDAQNFWVQISNNITARRKMSAKVIPNL